MKRAEPHPADIIRPVLPLTAGSRLGVYEILSVLGTGGMGEVYRARDTKLDRVVAIKVIGSPAASDPTSVARFEREAKVIAALAHPNILSIFDFGTWQGSLFSVTELLEGETLRDLLGGGTPRPLPPRKAADYALQITRGLAAAHEKSIVHRDLKPENVFVTHDGRVKILDFGLATIAASEPTLAGEASAAELTRLHVETTPGMVLGTIAYMAPEQARGQPVDSRTDIFALGAVLYEMLTGRKAFDSGSTADTLSAILNGDPPPLPVNLVTGPDASGLDRIVRRCLEKKPSERFQSALDVAFAIEAAGLGTTSSAVPSAGAPRMRLARPLAIALASAAVIAAAVWLGRRSVSTEPPVYTPLTFERGDVTAARFAPDGEVVYSARWATPPMSVYAVRTAQPSPRAPIVQNAYLIGVSSSGVLRVLLSPRGINEGQFTGTLAELPLVGGTPRELTADVRGGDCLPDGERCAIVRASQGRYHLEYPPGRTIYETSGYVSDVRIAPSGAQVAFMDHPVTGDDRGTVAMIAPGGTKVTLTPEWSSEAGLAWHPGGEIWFTAHSDDGWRLYAITAGRRLRPAGMIPGRLLLHDIDANGRVLIGQVEGRVHAIAGRVNDGPERDVTWLDWTVPSDLSRDGSLMAFSQQGMTGGRLYSAMFRKLDGSIPVRLGDGRPDALSPDGKWALVHVLTQPDRLLVEPLGPGEERDVTTPGFRYSGADWAAGDSAFVFSGAEGDRPRRVYFQVVGERPRAVTEEGITIPPHSVSPDGKLIVAQHRDRTWHLHSIQADRAPVALAGLAPQDVPIRWSADQRALFVGRYKPSGVDLSRYDVASGALTPWTSIQPSGDCGGIGLVEVSADGATYVYSCGSRRSALFLVNGLK